MRIDETTDAFWVLYLMNILQPADREEIETQTRRLLQAVKRKGPALDVSQSLAALVGANMAVLREDGRYSVTLLGLQKLSIFHLGYLRDKNRMFVLKNLLKKE